MKNEKKKYLLICCDNTYHPFKYPLLISPSKVSNLVQNGNYPILSVIFVTIVSVGQSQIIARL